MIKDDTEVIFIDEATPATLDIDDWKTLTQGGFAAYDVKYRTAKSFVNKCPMIITSQQPLKFDPSDQPAMDRRLRTYKFRSLPTANKRAASWLKRNPMECIAWAASVVCKVDDEDGGVLESREDSSEAEVREGRHATVIAEPGINNRQQR